MTQKNALDGEAPVLEFREYWVLLHYHNSQVHTDPGWKSQLGYLLGLFYLLIGIVINIK